MVKPDFSEEKKLWKQGYDLVIGVDEVGRGSFAGPVVASACAFVPHHSSFIIHLSSLRIDDSKRLKPQERRKAAAWIKNNCLVYSIGEVSVATINRVGIGRATTMAMRKAIGKILSEKNHKKAPSILVSQYPHIFVLVDAFHIKYLRGIGLANQKAIKKGDQKSISIAAASILAKTFRDSLMQRFANQYSMYGWGRNKGYGTRDHQEAIKRNGITSFHRKAFVETFLSKDRAFIA